MRQEIAPPPLRGGPPATDVAARGDAAGDRQAVLNGDVVDDVDAGNRAGDLVAGNVVVRGKVAKDRYIDDLGRIVGVVRQVDLLDVLRSVRVSRRPTVSPVGSIRM